jgi:putative pyruvate formate lyase activating enzyme
VKEMNRQQPHLVFDDQDIIQKGLIVRHLILPSMSEDSLHLLDLMEKNLTPHVGLSLMSQFDPRFRTPRNLKKTLTRAEYDKLVSKTQSRKSSGR